jgi:NAD(P)-dependent dehydrogenase (short-subunit alcohol dehydrogenase family)
MRLTSTSLDRYNDVVTEQPSDRVALVTGGGRGIGAGICRRLAADGLTVAVNYRRDAASAQELCDRIRAAGGRAEPFAAAVDDRSQCVALTRDVLDRFGRVDVLVANAGIASRGDAVVDTAPDEVDRLLRTHALSAFWLAQQLVPQMRELGRGDIVVVSSTTTRDVRAGAAPYLMAKLALEGLARVLAVEELPHGIHTNVVAPGLVATDMGDRLVRAVHGAASATELDAESPYGRVCRPEDVAAVVSFLIGPDAGYVNGQTVFVDGGRPVLGG